MLEKITDILTSWKWSRIRDGKTVFIAGNINSIAKEIYALRYDMARELIEEWWFTKPRDKMYEMMVKGDIDDWLAEQGEVITIDLLRRDNK